MPNRQKKAPAPVPPGVGEGAQRDLKNRNYNTINPGGMQATSVIQQRENKKSQRAEAWEKAVTKLSVEFEAAQGGGFPSCLKGLSPDKRLNLLRSLGFRVVRHFTVDAALFGQPIQLEHCVYLTGGLFVNLADGWVNRRVKL